MGKLFTPQPIASGFNTTNSLNENFSNLEAALDKCLSRDGETPNAMGVELDMNTHDITNVGTLHADVILLDNKEIPSVESLQGFLADAINTIDGKIDDADNLLDGKISDADILLGGKVSAAEGFSTSAGISAGNASVAQGLAEDAQQAAEDAVASLNLPSITPGDAEKILIVKADETGYEYTTLPSVRTIPTSPVTITVTSGGTYPTIQSALDYVKNTYLPGGSPVTITVEKTALTSSDSIFAKEGENLGWIDISLNQPLYTFSPSSTFMSGGAGSKLPELVLSVGNIEIVDGLVRLNQGSELRISGTSVKNLHLRSTNVLYESVIVNGGRLTVDGIGDFKLEGEKPPLALYREGTIRCGKTLKVIATNSLGLAISIEGGSRLYAVSAEITVNDFGPAVLVEEGASAYLSSLVVAGLTGSIGVEADRANLINLNGSAVTCNLTDNTVSTNGILIR